MRRLHSVAVLGAAMACLAWMNPARERVAEGNRLFKQGKFEAAAGKYGEALVDNPESPLLNFNMGDAHYKAGKYAEAAAAFARVRPSDDDPRRVLRSAYNAADAQYRLGAAAEKDKPQDALAAYAGALAGYRRVLGTEPTDQDAKFNYEFVSKKIEELKKKLEEQKQQQEEQQQQDEQKQDQQQDQQQQQADQQQKDQEQQAAQQQANEEKQKDQGEQQQAEQEAAEQQGKEEKQGNGQAGAVAGGDEKKQMSEQEAAALIDTAKNDELQPDEFARQVQGARVAEPAQDW